MEDIILEFWKCSLKSDFSEFDWDEAFDTYEPYLALNCQEHAQGTFEEYMEVKERYCSMDEMATAIENTDLFTTYSGNIWWSFNGYDAVEAIMRAQYEVCRAAFEGNVHGDNAKLLERIRNRGKMSESELISLFDECIHAQHCNGDILEDVDIESLREQAEKEYKEEKERFPTNIRDFLVQY